MATESDIERVSYPVFRGLQKPLEFMGLQGRYITWAACTVGLAIIGFIVAYCTAGLVAGLVILVAALTTGAAMVLIKQKRGLHGKRCDKGIFVYAHSREM
jgi:hypothetical protein